MYSHPVQALCSCKLKRNARRVQAGLERAIAADGLWLRESGTVVTFTEGGAALFA